MLCKGDLDGEKCANSVGLSVVGNWSRIKSNKANQTRSAYDDDDNDERDYKNGTQIAFEVTISFGSSCDANQ